MHELTFELLQHTHRLDRTTRLIEALSNMCLQLTQHTEASTTTYKTIVLRDNYFIKTKCLML